MQKDVQNCNLLKMLNFMKLTAGFRTKIFTFLRDVDRRCIVF